MPQDTRIPEGEPGLREQEDERQRDASREQSDAPHRKETNPKEPLEGDPGYGEPPPDVRRDKLPDQGW